MNFEVHTLDSAPAESRQALLEIEARYGFIPNLAGVFAESPGAFKGLIGALKSYDDKALTLTAIERQIVLLSVSVANRCDYCTAAHSMLLHSLGIERNEILKLQHDQPLGDARLQSLRVFTESVLEKHGFLDGNEVETFLQAGFTKGQVLEVLLGVSIKTLTNYANHVAKPPVNKEFRAFLPEWAAAA